MNNEATEQTTLAEQLSEILFPGSTKHHGMTAIHHALIEKEEAVKAAVLAREAQTVATELGDLDILDRWDAIRSTFGSVRPFGDSNQLAETARKMVVKFARHFASRPAAPPYYETAKRAPTEKDANDRGMVLAIGSRYKDGWTDKDFRDVSDLTEGWTHWMPTPPAPVPPVSAEDAARDAALEKARPMNAEGAMHSVWHAALTFAATQKPA